MVKISYNQFILKRSWRIEIR